MLTYEIKSCDHCRRLESFLRELIPAAAAAYPRKLIKSGAVKVNGTKASPDTILYINDQITLKESTTLTALLVEAPPEFDILYEDDMIIIANKPSGLPMHRTAEIEENLISVGMQFMEWRGTPCKLYPVNRLDRGTSGAVITAKSSSSAGIFGRQVKESGLDKLYLALVAGVPDDTGTIDAPLDDKESKTNYRHLAIGDGCTLLAVMPVSGRLHQIRRHLEIIGHPVIGDNRYGSGNHPLLNGLALHSFRTALTLPENRQLSVCAPLPDDLIALCHQSGIDRESLLQKIRELADSCGE